MLNSRSRLSGRSGVIPLEIRFYRIGGARISSRKRSSENGHFTSSSEELGCNSKRSGFRRTLVRPSKKAKHPKGARKAEKKIMSGEHDEAILKIGDVCGKAFVAAIKDYGAERCQRPRHQTR